MINKGNRNMKYNIVGVYNSNAEVLDSCETMAEAKVLVNEYRIAFGSGWTIMAVNTENL